MDNVLEKAGVTCLLHTRVTGVKMQNGQMTALECTDDEGTFSIQAKTFVDATGDAALAHLAGAGDHLGRRGWHRPGGDIAVPVKRRGHLL